jgi:hypothetical protein
MPQRLRAPVPPTLPIDQVHISHQLVMRQIRKLCGHPGVVQRDERQTAGMVPAGQPLDLSPAEPALAVENDQLGIRTLHRIGQAGRGVVGVHEMKYLIWRRSGDFGYDTGRSSQSLATLATILGDPAKVWRLRLRYWAIQPKSGDFGYNFCMGPEAI